MTSHNTAGSSDSDLVRALADILVETGLTEIEIERGELKIRVAKKLQATQTVVAAAPPTYAAATPPSPAANPSFATPEPSTGTPLAGEMVKSPMVGTVYLQPQPGAPPFVKKGDEIAAGQTLLLIEAMKTMNPITAPKSGRVTDVLVGDAQPVEFGEPLIVIG